jgi:hypothetical protein
MKIAGIVIDGWKAPVFRRHLDAAGFYYEEFAGPLNDQRTLRVSYEWVHKLQPIVEAANAECRRAP